MTEHLASPRRWLPFTTGVVVGLATGLLGMGLAVAAERGRRRGAGQAHGLGMPPGNPRRSGSRPAQAPVVYPPLQEAALDEELAQSFPASDPLPHPHQID